MIFFYTFHCFYLGYLPFINGPYIFDAAQFVYDSILNQCNFPFFIVMVRIAKFDCTCMGIDCVPIHLFSGKMCTQCII